MKNIHNRNVQLLNQSQTVKSHLKPMLSCGKKICGEWNNTTIDILNLFTDIYIYGDYDTLWNFINFTQAFNSVWNHHRRKEPVAKVAETITILREFWDVAPIRAICISVDGDAYCSNCCILLWLVLEKTLTRELGFFLV